MKVHIRRNEDGVIRAYEYDGGWEGHSGYLWLEGNYSCDCNRHLFFQRAAGEDDGEVHCGSTAYTILKFELASGEVVEGDASLSNTPSP